MLVVTANRFRSSVTIFNGRVSANGKSILDVMTLVAPKGATLRFEAEGDDAETLVQALVEVVKRGFDEM